MKLSYFLLVISAWSFFPQVYPQQEAKFKVYVFLSEECIISQSYALELRELHEQYASSELEFIGVFSNPASNPEKMAAFKGKYQFPFSFLHDRQQRLMDQFEVELTPEVVVYDAEREEVRYQGRIDNTFYRVGRRRSVTTTADLADALQALQNQQPVPLTFTPTVGCFITPAGDWIKNAPMCNPTPE
ncbi:MAG: redoxin domain-containing protein [Bacteroidota bacterium]